VGVTTAATCHLPAHARERSPGGTSSTVTLAIVYYSATGTLEAMAHHAADGAEKAGAEARLRRVARQATTGEREATDAQAAHAEPDDIVGTNAVLFGSPTRYDDIAGLHHLATRVVTAAGRPAS
jgi:hypothetical protein